MDYSQYTRPDLDNLATARGLDSTGARAVVTQRLLDYDRQQEDRDRQREEADAAAAAQAAAEAEEAARQREAAQQPSAHRKGSNVV